MIIMDALHASRNINSATRSFSGCWTCRLRRKKCDEQQPACEACVGLRITCHYHQDKPEWMDGGVRQEEMAARLKREVRDNAHLRPRLSERTPTNLAPQAYGLFDLTPDNPNSELESRLAASIRQHNDRFDCMLVPEKPGNRAPFARSDTVLITFYLENALPFLFPFYHPLPLEGGRSWILEMMISSPVVRTVIISQSSYFLSLARGVAGGSAAWETVLVQTKEAFEMLRGSLEIISASTIEEHLYGAVRIMTSITQIQRFEIAVLCVNNGKAHLNGALALFERLMGSADSVRPIGVVSSFNAVISRLGSPSPVVPDHQIYVPTAEQTAFRFSSALLLFDDIIASTMLQDEPKLYPYHAGLLGRSAGTDPVLDLEAIVGCQNLVLIQIGKTAVLDAWKQKSRADYDLDVVELVRQAAPIQQSLEGHLKQLQNATVSDAVNPTGLLAIFSRSYSGEAKSARTQTAAVTRVWAHAALVYLSVVVSGWQPASTTVRFHVSRIIEILTQQMSPPELLRSVSWPFCVAGCLADATQQARLREMVQSLQPQTVFGTLCRALRIMEQVWRRRSTEDTTHWDLAMCFKSEGELLLLL